MSEEPSRAIVTEIRREIAIVRFNRPAQRNPLSRQTLDQLQRTTTALFLESRLRAVIFTGAADVFAAGADIRELAQLDTTSALEFSRLGQELFQTIANARLITIAAINGYCMGGALDLALACDIRVASKAAVFSHPGARLGIITGWGGTQRLPKIIGRSGALELFVTARRIDSATALRLGLVTQVEDPILDCALKLAERTPHRLSPTR
jgi:enoyl-CoA hydratase